MDDALAGRTNLRDVVKSEVFSHNTLSLAQRGDARIKRMSEQERERLAALGAQEIAKIREKISQKPEKPETDVGSDDDYFVDPTNWMIK